MRCSQWGAVKSLQSCPILCDPIDGSPPGSPVPGILQARTLECGPGHSPSLSPTNEEALPRASAPEPCSRGLRPPEQLERPAGFPSSDKTRPDSPVPILQGPVFLP